MTAVHDSSKDYVYFFDGNGNVVDMYSTDGTTSVANYDYDPFGRITKASGDMAETNTFRFSTKQFEPGHKLYYYGHRFYSPGLGRWMSRDPIYDLGTPPIRSVIVAPAEPDAALYEFGMNDPMDRFDALGLWSFPWPKKKEKRPKCTMANAKKGLTWDDASTRQVSGDYVLKEVHWGKRWGFWQCSCQAEASTELKRFKCIMSEACCMDYTDDKGMSRTDTKWVEKGKPCPAGYNKTGVSTPRWIDAGKSFGESESTRTKFTTSMPATEGDDPRVICADECNTWVTGLNRK